MIFAANITVVRYKIIFSKLQKPQTPYRTSHIQYSFRLILFLIVLLLYKTGSAQYFSLGQDPASTKWRQAKTEHFRIIYPDSFEKQSLYIVNALEVVYGPESSGLKAYPKRIPVIIHDQSVYSNALVPYAPRRMELYTTPPQDTEAQDWLDQLVLHEFRHVVQYQKINQGFTHVLSWFFGQQIIAGVYGLFAPFWFIEGDAVVIETAMSKSGRGRVPAFEMPVRAQFLEKKIYNYDKATHGSFKDFTPNRYELGYQMVAYTRQQYGKNAWNKSLDLTAKYPFMIVPFSQGLNISTGLGKVKLYKKNTQELKLLWEQQHREIQYTPFKKITKTAKHYTDYKNGVFINDTTLIAQKSGIDDITRIVRINTKAGTEDIVVTPGTSYFDYSLSSDGKIICWGERVPDPRWQQRNYAVVNYYDLRKNKLRQLTSRSRYFAPAVSHDGTMIAVVEVTNDNRYYLIILNAREGLILNRISTSENFFFTIPAWSPDNIHIVSMVLGEKGKSMVKVNTKTSGVKLLLPFSHTEISKPVFFRNFILFTGGYSGIDNIYALDTLSSRISRLTSAAFGATDAAVSPGGEQLVYSNYTADGYELVIADIIPGQWKPLEIVKDNSIRLYDSIAAQEGFLFKQKNAPGNKPDTKKYKKGLNLFNIHSWAPVSLDLDNMSLNPGITLMSQNLLSSSFATIGYEYNLNEEAGRVFLNYSYQGHYPVLDLRVDYGLRRGSTLDGNQDTINYKWYETNLKAHLRVPLNLTKNKYYRMIQPRFGTTMMTFLDMDKESPVRFKKDRLVSLDYQLYAYNQIKRSKRDLFPKWGQMLEVNYRNTPFDTESVCAIFSAEAYLYFPGVIRHHGIRLYGGWQETWGDYSFSDMVFYPRGMSNINENDILSLKVDYIMPLAYPDWRLGPVFYMKRIKARLFYDYAIGYTSGVITDYQSTGIDLTTDIHFFSILFPFDTGVRAIYFPQTSTYTFQFLITIDAGTF